MRALCEREVDVPRLQAWETGADAAEVALFEQVAQLGWVGIGVPVSAGGSGAPLSDVAMLVAECARGLVPRSVLGPIEAAFALGAVAPQSVVLEQLARGDNRLALAVDEESARDPRHFTTRVVTTSGAACVSGGKAYVSNAVEAELHLVVVREVDEAALVLVEAGDPRVVCEPLRTFGGDRQAHVRYENVPIVEQVGGAEAVECLARTQSALALAEMIGGIDAVLAMTVEYVQEREQFGQKIALFQAVRHQIADMGIRFTAARHLAWQAITRIDRGLVEGHEIESALAYVGRAFRDVCFAGHHLHGGAGFVVEHRLRFHSERAQSLAVRYAAEAPALETIARALLD